MLFCMHPHFEGIFDAGILTHNAGLIFSIRGLGNNMGAHQAYIKRRLAQGRTSWIERSKTYVRFPVEVAIADLLHFVAYNEGPPWRPRMSFSKDPNAIVLGTRAAAFLFLDGSAVLVLRARGERDSPSTLGFREGMEGPSTPLAADASKRKFGGTSTNVLSANYSKLIVFDLAVSAAGWRLYVSVRCG